MVRAPNRCGLGFGVWGLGFGVWGLGLRIWGWGLRVKVWGLGFGFWGWGLGIRVWGLGFGIWGWGLGSALEKEDGKEEDVKLLIVCTRSFRICTRARVGHIWFAARRVLDTPRLV